MKTFYITTPIYYVNGAPHVGSLYTTLAADVLARHYRNKLGPDNVFFLTGTDEHGQKVAEYAEKAGMDPKQFADSVVPEFKKAWAEADISYDYFMRTTDPGHAQHVGRVFQKLYDEGHIYKGLYEGQYCVGCEKFITEVDMVDGRCPLHPDKDLIFQKEENYFFKLSKWAPKVLELIRAGEYNILPDSRKAEIISRLEQGVDDISISRESVSWGISLPWDNTHTFYVWVEALFNYYTATQFVEGKERFWPAQVHLLAKDIVWFHSVIWQALLLAAELPLPKTIFAHGFFTVDGQKMSKSLGNVITPSELVGRYGVDGARYVLLTANQFGNDGDISLQKLDALYNADLAHGLGNLVARTAKLAEGLQGTAKPNTISPEVSGAIEQFDFSKALENIWARVSRADKYLNEHEPWKIKDDPEKKSAIVLHVVQELVSIAFDLEAVMPSTSETILTQFTSDSIAPQKPLFERLA